MILLLVKIIGQVIFIKGYSGDTAYRYGDEFVKETDGDPKRLLHQAHKQMKYRERLPLTNFAVPKVTRVFKNGFAMEYVEGKSLIDLLKEPSKVEWVADNIIELLEWEFSHTTKRIFRVKPFINKLSSKCPIDLQEFLLKECKKLRFKLYQVGYMHGDLTCANMLFTKDKIYLIDFLKVFMRTPYQDIAKLYQEFDLYWVLLMSDYTTENKDIKYGYDYLAWRITEWARKSEFIDFRFVKVFRLMCLLRLFPYIPDNDKELFNLVYKRATDLMEDW